LGVLRRSFHSPKLDSLARIVRIGSLADISLDHLNVG